MSVPSFSTVQVITAWFVGFSLGAGAFGIVHGHGWRGIMGFPLLFGSVFSLAAIGTFVATHWSDHD